MRSWTENDLACVRLTDFSSPRSFTVWIEASREKVLHETYRILSEQGFSGASIDAIAKGSGVAKTTIYRHWPSREDLLLDACAKLGVRTEPPDTGSLREDLNILLSHLARNLKAAGWPSILPSIIDVAERDPDVASVFKKLHSNTTAPYRAVLVRAQERGDFSRGIKISDLLSMTVGALFYNRWYSREPLNDKFVERLLDRIMASVESAR
jgi:AcrR family transcriptional regulator